MKIFTPLKTLALMAIMLITPQLLFAGDGTKASPYTVAELNAQKDALASSGATVWVKADLKGLGEDGLLTDNADTEDAQGKTVKHMAGLFGDDTGTFVAYSWQILGQLALSDLTNTKDLLISLTYGTTGHPYGNTTNPQYASNEEPTEAHFSLEEVHGALSLEIKNYRGYHIPACYIIPSGVVASKVSCGYSQAKGAYVNCDNYFNGSDSTVVTEKNSALVLIAKTGTYNFVLSAGLHPFSMGGTVSMYGGTKDGINTVTTNNRYLYRFVTSPQVGFQRNSDNQKEVTLEAKDEIFLAVNALSTNFFGKWTWETDDKKWISWGKNATFDFASEGIRENIGANFTDAKGYFYNETFKANNVTLQITAGSAPSRIYVDANRGQNLTTYKEYATLTFKAPEGYAITKIEFTAAGNSNINNFTASSGTIEGMNWTGNTEGVRFNQGGTSYLANAKVTLAAKNDATSALPAIEYTECANIAAFNALEKGTYAKVTLTDAEVTGISPDGYSTIFIQDATGGCQMQYTSLNIAGLKEKTKLNGWVYAVKRMSEGNVQMKEAEKTLESEISATEISDYTMIEGTISEINTLANLNRVVKITGASFEATTKTAGNLTQGDVSIIVNNASTIKYLGKIEGEWTVGDKMTNVTIIAILVGTKRVSSDDDSADMEKNILLPISMTGTPAGISNITTDVKAENVVIYNLSGQRVEHPTKGIYIVNGRKYVIR